MIRPSKSENENRKTVPSVSKQTQFLHIRIQSVFSLEILSGQIRLYPISEIQQFEGREFKQRDPFHSNYHVPPNPEQSRRSSKEQYGEEKESERRRSNQRTIRSTGEFTIICFSYSRGHHVHRFESITK